MLLREMAVYDRPDQRCISKGANTLSDTELLASIIRGGTKDIDGMDIATQILTKEGEWEGVLKLSHLTLYDLKSINGIGEAKAVQLLCVVELAKRMIRAKRKEGIKLMSPYTVADYYMEDMRHLDTEQVLLVMVDSKSKILAEKVISTGTVNASIVAPREIFIHALKEGATNIILIHNHPSGDTTPSNEDIATTKRVKEAGSLIGIKLIDHIIIGDNNYVSLKEKDLL